MCARASACAHLCRHMVAYQHACMHVHTIFALFCFSHIKSNTDFYQMCASVTTSPKMGEDYTQLPSSHPSIIVHFYGKHAFSTKPLPVAVEPSVSCEDVLIRCANHLSESLGRFHPRAKERQIGPWLLPLFGLYAANHKLQQWVPEAYMFDDNENQQEFYFRVKVRLARSRLPDGVFSDYLFWQVGQRSRLR